MRRHGGKLRQAFDDSGLSTVDWALLNRLRNVGSA